MPKTLITTRMQGSERPSPDSGHRNLPDCVMASHLPRIIQNPTFFIYLFSVLGVRVKENWVDCC